MTLKLITEKLSRSSKKFITVDELKIYCKTLSLSYIPTVKYLIRHAYLARIFKGIFYIYSVRERKLNTAEMNFHEILKEAMKLKGVTHWYFGLETALKLNNLTHESFTIEFILNDTIFRAKPRIIMGRKVKFYRLVPKMFSFGINRGNIPYSDPEKTALDLLSLKHYTLSAFEELTEELSKKKLLAYAKKYNLRIQKKVKRL